MRTLLCLSPGLLAIVSGLIILFSADGSDSSPLDIPPLSLGELKEGLTEHEFIVSNRAKVPVKILETRTTCSCRKIKISAQTIAPMDSVVGSLLLDTRGESGDIRDGFTIFVELQNLGSVRLIIPVTIQYSVTPEFSFSDYEPVIYCSDNFVEPFVLNLIPIGDDDVRITEVSSSFDSGIELNVGRDGRSIEIIPDAKSVTELGLIGDLSIKTTNKYRQFVKIPIRVYKL